MVRIPPLSKSGRYLGGGLKYSLFSSRKLEKRSRLTNIFFKCSNHQLVRITPLGNP